jgi:hypothetical protein
MPRLRFPGPSVRASRSIFEVRVTGVRDKDETALAVLALVAGDAH